MKNKMLFFKDGKPAQPFGAYKRLDNGARIVALGEGMASLFLGAPNWASAL